MNPVVFLFLVFMSVVYLIYILLPKKARPYCLLISSLLFYAVYSKFMTAFLLATIVTIYLGGVIINKLDDKFQQQKEGLEKEQRKALKERFKRKKKLAVALIVIFNVAILGVLKYFNFFGSVFSGVLSWFNVTASVPVLKLALPLGISYYTLSAIGYLVDVYRGKHRGGNFLEVALFISYFPQLFEGPFATFDKLSPQLQAGVGFNPDNFFNGMLSVVWGFFKTVVVADRLSIIVGPVFSNYASYNGLVIVIAIVLFTFQLYAEFSGMIDVASGISEMFGIKLAKNFEQPFFSQNVSEFWRRWHMSLGAWLREYIFYPISMSKGFMKMNKRLQGKVNPFFQVLIPSLIALFVVWFVNGIWHGAELKYIVYGLYYYVLTIVGMCLEPLSNLIYSKTKINKNHVCLKILRIVRTFVLVNIGMLIFRATNLSDAVNMFAQIFKGGSINLIAEKVIDVHDTVWAVIGLAAVVVYDILKERKIDLKDKLTHSHLALKYATLLVFAFVIILFGAYGDGYIPPDPIYGAF